MFLTGMTAPLPLRAASMVAVVAVLACGPFAAIGRAADGLTMEARVLLQGHARVGAWMAIEVRLKNDGPPVTGELRMDGGSQGRASFSLPVDVPTTSDKTYVLHAQPQEFGRNVRIDLVAGEQVVASQTAAYLVHDGSQLIVGVLAERPQGIVAEIDLPDAVSGGASVVVPLSLGDLPRRLEGWAPLDRLVWQDVDSNSLTSEQLTALRGWIAAGGQLVIVGGTSGPSSLAAFPADLLPYRPTTTVDVAPESVASLLGGAPSGAGDLPALAGTLAHGRALASSGDWAIAGRLSYGSGTVTLLGIDPAAGWPAESKGVTDLWRNLLPLRGSVGGTVSADDSSLVRAVQQLPILAPPPTGGLLLLIAAYIAVVGPLNYLILRRLDRREWAWITMPVLVAGFAAAAYGYGAVLRGTDIVVNQVAIIRGSPGATEGTAQVYFGIFSPTRGTYRVDAPDRALLGPTISGETFGSTDAGALDIVQSDGDGPSSVRNLSVGFSSLRFVRAETPTSVPLLRASLDLRDGKVSGALENASDEALEDVAIVLGSSVVVLGDVAAHATVQVSLTPRPSAFGASLADRIIGPQFGSTADANRAIRYTMLQQLTYDPVNGYETGLDADGPVVLAFTGRDVLGLVVEGQQPLRTSNAMYYVPLSMAVHGHVTFEGDLIRQVLLSNDGMGFGKGEASMITMGRGTVTAAYRPIGYEGSFEASGLRLGINPGDGSQLPAAGQTIEPLASVPVTCTDAKHTEPPGCVPSRDDWLPDVEVFDRSGAGAWVRLPRFDSNVAYTLANPEPYVDPGSGEVLVRFVNDNPDTNPSFGFEVAITGDVR